MGDAVVDGVHQRVFISDPSNGKIVVTDCSGTVVKQLTSLQGVTDLELSAGSDTVYAAVPSDTGIVAFAAASANGVPGGPLRCPHAEDMNRLRHPSHVGGETHPA
ncbi:hypothetical protein [Streptomyces sp. NPDC001348]